MVDTSTASTGRKKKPIKRFYGLTRCGKKPALMYFIVRDVGNIPEDAVLVRETMEPSDVVLKLAADLLETGAPDTDVDSFEIPSNVDETPVPGDIVYFVDGEHNHLAILLGMGPIDSFVLFLTTKPSWNSSCRRIKRDEMAFTGWSMRDTHVTYLAPVIRPNYQIIKTGRSISEQRLESLRAEFSREKAVGY